MSSHDEPKRPEYPHNSAEYCAFLKAMDRYYNTPKESPLHHDNRCVLMFRDEN